MSILSRLELVLPVRCENYHCANYEKVLNNIFVPMDELETFSENFGQGSEDTDTDTCPQCAELGILRPPLPFFFYTLYQKDQNLTLAIKSDQSLVECLSRLLKSNEEDNWQIPEKVYLAADEMCNLSNHFHVYRVNDNGDFNNQSFDFSKYPFVERNKIVYVSPKGAYLSCDIKDKGKLMCVQSCYFTVSDLSVLNEWVIKNVEV
jgi:hypothetical protein